MLEQPCVDLPRFKKRRVLQPLAHGDKHGLVWNNYKAFDRVKQILRWFPLYGSIRI
jgi:hypothetical protein